jgi:hypothetical protein
MPKPQTGQYRCEATMSNGSTGIIELRLLIG